MRRRGGRREFLGAFKQFVGLQVFIYGLRWPKFLGREIWAHEKPYPRHSPRVFYVCITSFSRVSRPGPERRGSWLYASPMDLESNYEIARTVEFIHSRNFTRVALQVTETQKEKKQNKQKKKIPINPGKTSHVWIVRLVSEKTKKKILSLLC